MVPLGKQMSAYVPYSLWQPVLTVQCALSFRPKTTQWSRYVSPDIITAFVASPNEARAVGDGDFMVAPMADRLFTLTFNLAGFAGTLIARIKSSRRVGVGAGLSLNHSPQVGPINTQPLALFRVSNHQP